MTATVRGQACIDVRVDGQSPTDTSPVVALRVRPRLSWRTEGNLDGSPIPVELRNMHTDELVWQTHVGTDVSHVDVPVDLPAYESFSWSVGAAGGEQSATMVFETGPWALSDWHAEWLEVPNSGVVRTRFSTHGAASARLHLAAQGLVLVRINGRPLNADRIDPSRTDIGRALFRTFDVGPFLIDGSNELEAVMGVGEWHKTGLPPRLLLQLRIALASGGVQWVVPEPGAEVVASEVEVETPFYLERVHRSAAGGWIGVTRALAAAVAPADPVTPPSMIMPDPAPPIRAGAVLTAREIGRSGGARQYDVGVNVAGRSRVVLRSGVPVGTVVRIIHGEHVDDGGRVDTTNITMPYDRGRDRQVLEQVTTGHDGEVVEAVFAYHGFRYLEVRGLPDAAVVEVSVRPFHTDLRRRAAITIEHPLIARLIERAERTALNTVHGVPEDCPTREQAAWTGDMASAADFHFAHFDDATFMTKWLGDLATSQGDAGDIPGIAPNVGPSRAPSDPIWGGALHRVLLNHWLHVGDDRVVAQHLPVLRRWATFQLGRLGERGVAEEFPISYGQDWLALEQTPAALLHSGAVVDSLMSLARLEKAAGDAGAAAGWKEQADRLRARMREVFLDLAGTSVANGSQGSLAVALESGMLTPEEEPRFAARLAALVAARGDRVSGGFATTRSIVRMLAEHGYSSQLLACLLQPEEPGIGAMLETGPGTFWENWWIDPGNTGTGSLDHLGLGAPFAAWVWEHLIAIRPIAGGYRRFELRPALLPGIGDLDAVVQTRRGVVEVHQRTVGDVVRVTVTVPASATGVLVLPGRDPEELEAGYHVRESRLSAAANTAPLPAAPRWSPPSIAPVADDERGGVRLDGGASFEPGIGAPSFEKVAQLVCMPVPHAQYAHPVLHVQGGSGEDVAAVVAHFPTPIDLTGRGFAYASIDQCAGSPAEETSLILVALLENGARLAAEARAWPASWNRVTVNLQGVSGRLIGIEAGLRTRAPSGPSATRSGRLAFHLGEMGMSERHSRW